MNLGSLDGSVVQDATILGRASLFSLSSLQHGQIGRLISVFLFPTVAPSSSNHGQGLGTINE